MERLSFLKITSWMLLIAAVLQTGCSVYGISEWDQCIPKCQCLYAYSRKQASCEKAGMTEIPSGLSVEFQILMFDGNNVTELGNRTFAKVGLVNLQKISLKSCSIVKVHKEAFADLPLIAYIYLSENQIKHLDPLTFLGAYNLRVVEVNNNLIQRLETNLFADLFLLKTVEFDNNQITEIGERAFFNLTKLQKLTFVGNQLVQLQPSVFQRIGGQKLSFDLRENHWKCDCKLRPFFDFLKRNNHTLSKPTLCDQPDNMQNKEWDSLTSEQFACAPIIEEPKEKSSQLEAQMGKELTLSCKVTGDPRPEMNWFFNGYNDAVPLNNNTNYRPGIDRKYTIYQSGNTTEWCNLTISNFDYTDKGVYTCQALNDGGHASKVITMT